MPNLGSDWLYACRQGSSPWVEARQPGGEKRVTGDKSVKCVKRHTENKIRKTRDHHLKIFHRFKMTYMIPCYAKTPKRRSTLVGLILIIDIYWHLVMSRFQLDNGATRSTTTLTDCQIYNIFFSPWTIPSADSDVLSTSWDWKLRTWTDIGFVRSSDIESSWSNTKVGKITDMPLRRCPSDEIRGWYSLNSLVRGEKYMYSSLSPPERVYYIYKQPLLIIPRSFYFASRPDLDINLPPSAMLCIQN